VADPNAEQPSDEGLETMAAIGGDLIAPVEVGGEEEAGADATREEGPEGGRRGRGRWRRRGGRGPRGAESSEFAGDWRPSGESESGESLETAAAANDDSEQAFTTPPVWSAEGEVVTEAAHAETSDTAPAQASSGSVPAPAAIE